MQNARLQKTDDNPESTVHLNTTNHGITTCVTHLWVQTSTPPHLLPDVRQILPGIHGAWPPPLERLPQPQSCCCRQGCYCWSWLRQRHPCCPRAGEVHGPLKRRAVDNQMERIVLLPGIGLQTLAGGSKYKRQGGETKGMSS